MIDKVRAMKDQKDIKFSAMEEGGKILSAVLKKAIEASVSGVSTKEIAQIAKKELILLDGEPAFLGYGGFPDVICISVNEQVVHGVPGSYILKKGDVVGLDFGVKHKGFFTDAARTIIVDENTDKSSKRLLDTTRVALDKAIEIAVPGARIGDLGNVIQNTLESAGFGVVRDLVGHGVGRSLHEDPNVPNYGTKNTGPILHEGQTLAIEPMSTIGSYKVATALDGWTIITQDGSLSAHFEETIWVTKNGAIVLTK